MRFSDEFRSPYLKAADLGGRERKYTIRSVNKEEVGDDQKIVIRFDETDLGLVLNKTNGSIIAADYGDDMSRWLLKPLWLRPEKTMFNGKPTDCIRVRTLQQNPESQQAPEDRKDDVPF